MSIYASSEAGSGSNQDRVAYFKHGQYEVVVVADGAGGQAGGGIAAEISIGFLKDECGKHCLSPETCSQLLCVLDSRLRLYISAGESTAVMLVSHGDHVFGASVGDSEAWLIAGDEVTVLTGSQYRKPLLGSGAAIPVEFGPTHFAGTLVIGSDGLFNYVRRNRIIECVGRTDEAELAMRLIGEARMPVGGLQDDTTVLVCSREKQRTKVRPKLLLVENHGVFAKTVVREFLKEYDVLCVPTVFEATNALVRETFVALLVDYDLDDGKGVEVIEAAKKLAVSPVIIASSAHDFGNQALMKAGASAICKKAHFHKIGEVLNACLNRAS